MFLIFVNLRVLLIFVIRHFDGEGAIHQCFILGCDFSWSGSIDDVGVIAASNKKRAESNSEVKTVTSLPIEYISWRGDDFWKLVNVL